MSGQEGKESRRREEEARLRKRLTPRLLLFFVFAAMRLIALAKYPPPYGY